MSVNIVANAYRELEHEGVIELRHGSGALSRNARVESSPFEDMFSPAP